MLCLQPTLSFWRLLHLENREAVIIYTQAWTANYLQNHQRLRCLLLRLCLCNLWQFEMCRQGRVREGGRGSCPYVGYVACLCFWREYSHVEIAQDLIYHLVVIKKLYLHSEQWKTELHNCLIIILCVTLDYAQMMNKNSQRQQQSRAKCYELRGWTCPATNFLTLGKSLNIFGF